jgi:hypothetical protein
MDYSNYQNNDQNNLSQIKSELNEMGFLTEHIDLATTISTDREEIINM